MAHHGGLIAVMAVCVIVEVVLIGADAGVWGSPRWRVLAYQNGGFWVGLLGNWTPNYALQPALMWLTYGFLHGGFWHMALNMLTLLSLGRVARYRLGPCRAGQWRLAGLYLTGLLGGGAGFALLSSSVQPMVGASGALFGLAGAWMSWDYLDRRAGGPLRWPVLWPVLRMVLGLIALNVAMYWAMDGLLAWETHLGGFVAGSAFVLLGPGGPRRDPAASGSA
jgi:rhomboid protease GluP